MTATGDESDQEARDVVVRTAAAEGGSPAELAERLRARDDVADVQVLPGLVKTFPPVVELVVDFARPEGPVRRVYDLVEETDGALHVTDSHA